MRKTIILILAIACSYICYAQNCDVNIMSYNIRHTGEKSDTGVKAWENRRFASINMINSEQPDVVCMQEVKPEQKEYFVENLPNYSAIDSEKKNSKFIIYRNDRFTCLDFGNFWLSETPDIMSKGWGSVSFRATLWVKLKDIKTSKVFYVFNTHLDVKSVEARDKGAQMTIDRMKKIAGKNGVQFLCGDMNTNFYKVKDIFMTWLSSAREITPDTDNKGTYNGFGKYKKNRVIDHIYFKNATPVKFETLDGKEYGTPYISDHYPISFKATF